MKPLLLSLLQAQHGQSHSKHSVQFRVKHEILVTLLFTNKHSHKTLFLIQRKWMLPKEHYLISKSQVSKQTNYITTAYVLLINDFIDLCYFSCKVNIRSLCIFNFSFFLHNKSNTTLDTKCSFVIWNEWHIFGLLFLNIIFKQLFGNDLVPHRQENKIFVMSAHTIKK